MKGLMDGSSPLLNKSKPGEYSVPFNPLTGERYGGANMIALTFQGFNDPRWLTFDQAKERGYRIRKGEKGTKMEIMDFYEDRPVLDPAGDQRIDKDGNPATEKKELLKPTLWKGALFNAEQIEGIVPHKKDDRRNEKLQVLQKVLEFGGAKFKFDQQKRAFFDVKNNTIRMPPKEAFQHEEGFLRIAFHEYYHWTGSKDVFDRETAMDRVAPDNHPREELRASIASFVVGIEYGIGYDPGINSAFAGHWISGLENNQGELLKACQEAEKVTHMINLLSGVHREEIVVKTVVKTQEPKIEKTPQTAQTPQKSQKERASSSEEIIEKRIFLAVPFSEKNEAKQAAKEAGFSLHWDKGNKVWSAPAGVNISSLSKWVPKEHQSTQSPQEAFGETLRRAGLILDGPPIMDGKFHRVPVEGGKPGSKDGSYQGFLDGNPAGFYQNFKDDFSGTWKESGTKLSAAQHAAIQAERKQRHDEMQEETKAHQREVAKKVQTKLSAAPPAVTHPYLQRKQISGIGLKIDEKHNLLIPLRDINGDIWSMQKINEQGGKFYEKGGRKKGLFAVPNPNKPPRDGEVIMIAEGYATASSVAQATQAATIAALDVYNLEVVAQQIKQKYPNSPIVILGDDDPERKMRDGSVRSIGRDFAENAARSIEGTAVFPNFGSKGTSSERKDWNDLFVQCGSSSVQRQLSSCLQSNQNQMESRIQSVENER